MPKNKSMKWLVTSVAVLMMVFGLAAAAMAQDHAETPVPEGTASGETHETGGTTPAEGGEEAVSPLEPLGINVGFLIVQLVNFGIIFFAITSLVWRPATRMLDARAADIQKGLEDAAAAAKARMNAEADAEKILADARAAAAKEIADSRARGDELAKTIQSEARTAAGAEADRIRAEANAARSEQLSGLREQVLNIAVALAGRIIQENLTANDKKQQALVSDFFSKVPASAKSLAGSIEVVSAMPLSADEQSNAKKQLGASDVTFTVDPSILGGLVIKSADRVIDGSVKSGLGDLAGQLN